MHQHGGGPIPILSVQKLPSYLPITTLHCNFSQQYFASLSLKSRCLDDLTYLTDIVGVFGKYQV